MHSRCTSVPDTELYDKLISLAYIIMQYVLKYIFYLKHYHFKMYIK